MIARRAVTKSQASLEPDGARGGIVGALTSSELDRCSMQVRAISAAATLPNSSLTGQDAGLAVGFQRGIRGPPARHEGDLGRAPIGPDGTARNVDDPRNHLPLDEPDKGTF